MPHLPPNLGEEQKSGLRHLPTLKITIISEKWLIGLPATTKVSTVTNGTEISELRDRKKYKITAFREMRKLWARQRKNTKYENNELMTVDLKKIGQ